MSGLLGTTFLCGTALPALAATADSDTLDLSDLQQISDGSMQKLRGGFKVGGFDISFGVTVTTTVNGATVLQTSFNVDDPNQITNIKTSVAQNSQSEAPTSNGTSTTVPGVTVKGPSVNVDVDVKVDVSAVHQAVDAFKESTGNGNSSGNGTTTSVATVPADPPAVVSTTAPTTGNAGTTPDFQGTNTPLPSPTVTIATVSTTIPADTGSTNTPAPSSTTVTMASTALPTATGGTTDATNGDGSWVVSQLSDGSGIKMTSADLATTIVQRFGNGSGVTTDITNTANDRTFTNSTDMNVFLNNFAQVASQSITNRLLTNLSNDLTHTGGLTN